MAYLEDKIKEMTTCLNRKVMERKYLEIAIYLLQIMIISHPSQMVAP